MRISEDADYLVFYSTNNKNEKETVDNVSFFFDYAEVLNSWTSTTRVSALYRLNIQDNNNFSVNIPNNKYYLLFIGPISPFRLDSQVFSSTNLWISYGFFNIVSLVQEHDIEKVLDFLIENKIRFEKWEIERNTIINKEFNLKKEDFERLDLSVIKNYKEAGVLYSSLKRVFNFS